MKKKIYAQLYTVLYMYFFVKKYLKNPLLEEWQIVSLFVWIQDYWVRFKICVMYTHVCLFSRRVLIILGVKKLLIWCIKLYNIDRHTSVHLTCRGKQEQDDGPKVEGPTYNDTHLFVLPHERIAGGGWTASAELRRHVSCSADVVMAAAIWQATCWNRRSSCPVNPAPIFCYILKIQHSKDLWVSSKFVHLLLHVVQGVKLLYVRTTTQHYIKEKKSLYTVQQSVEFTRNGVENMVWVRGAAGWNTLSMREIRGDRPDWSELTRPR